MLDSYDEEALIITGLESRELSGFMLPVPRVSSFLVDVRRFKTSRFLAYRTPGFVELDSAKLLGFIECVFGVRSSAGVME